MSNKCDGIRKVIVTRCIFNACILRITVPVFIYAGEGQKISIAIIRIFDLICDFYINTVGIRKRGIRSCVQSGTICQIEDCRSAVVST